LETQADLNAFQRFDGILQTFGWLLHRFSGPCLSAVWLEIFGRGLSENLKPNCIQARAVKVSRNVPAPATVVIRHINSEEALAASPSPRRDSNVVYKHSVRRPFSETVASPRRNSNLVGCLVGRSRDGISNSIVLGAG